MEKDSANHSIACEQCRARKCKCDRKLPSCSQCAVENQPCRYPAANKRGVPTGYIAALEKRLVETEYALYQALTPEEATGDKDSSSYDAFFSRFAGLPKTTRISEWDRWPLQTRGEREAWLQDRLASVTTPMNHGTTETTTVVAPGLAGSSKTQPPSSARSPFDVDGSGVSETAGDVLQERQGHLTTLENSTGTDSWTWTGDLEFGPSPTAPTPQPFPTAPVVSPKKRKEPYTNSVTLGNSRYQASHAQQHVEAETGLDGGKWHKYF